MNWDKFTKTKKTTSNAGEKMQPNFVRIINEDGSKGLKIDGKYNIQEQIEGHIEECMFNAEKIAINEDSMLPTESQFINKEYNANESIIERQQQHEQNNILRQKDLDYIVNQIRQQEQKAKEEQEEKGVENV